MMEFGYLGSSSNLSPLARPFTLDHSVPIPNADIFVNFTDPPPAVPFSSSLPSWQYSPSFGSNPNCYSDSSADLGVDSIRTTYLASGNYYPYFGVPPHSSPTTQMPPISANVSTTTDAFVFPQYSDEIRTGQVESKSYCSSFVSPVVEDDAPLAFLHKPNYDISSTSHITPLNGSSQVDYQQSLSGLKYKPPWGGYWNRSDRLADGEMGKPVVYDGSFCCPQTDDVGSYAYKSYLKQGASTTEGSSMGKESLVVTHQTCLNLLGGESSIITPISRDPSNKPFSTPGSSFTPYPARTLGISTFPKSHANVTPVEAATTFLNHPKPLQDQSLQSLNAGKIGSVVIKKPSPAVVIRPPSVGSSFRLEKKDHFSDSRSPNIKGELPNKPPAEEFEEHLSQVFKEFQLSEMNAPPYSLTSTSDRVKSASSVEGPLESLDRYYPALDSPCWKGISSFGFSPSEDHGSVTSEHLLKKPESLGALKLQQTQFCTPFGEDNAKKFSKKAHENSIYQENGYVELGSLLCPDGSPNTSSPVKVDSLTYDVPNANIPVKVDNSTYDDGVNHAKMSSSKLDLFSNKVEQLTKEFVATNDSKSCPGLTLSQSKQQDTEEDLKLGFGVAVAGLNCNDAASKLDARKLVETIHNLSGLLLFQCSDDASGLSEVDHKALLLAMKNLDACVSKIIPNPTQEPNLHKSVLSGRAPMSKEASSRLGFDDHRSEQGTKNCELYEKEAKKLTDLLSARVDDDFEKDYKVTRAIKKVLEENFSDEEEVQSDALLYKNLWFEAEAALCSISFKARYDRMKTEMYKHKLPKRIEPVATFEELYDEVFPDPSSTEKGNPVIEAFKMLHKCTQDPSASKTTEIADEAKSSFRGRVDILNNRLANQNSVRAEEETDGEADAAFAEVIKTVETLFSSDDVEDCAMTNLTPKVAPNSVGSTVPGSSIPDSSSSSTSKTGDSVDASVMARFQILKDRRPSAISEKSGQQSEPAIGSDYSGQRNPWRVSAVLYEDGIVDGPLSQDCKVSEYEMVKDVFASYDLTNQLGGSKRLGTQLSSGWCDGSLSDWEDVLKDEFACQK